MASPIVDTTFTSGTTITSNWLNGVNDAINDATQDITGAIARTVVSKLADTISVKDFGAVGDGVTDDTAAIQAAVDGSPAGAVIEIYDHVLSDAIIIDKPLTILSRGVSTVVQTVWGVPAWIVAGGVSNVQFLGSQRQEYNGTRTYPIPVPTSTNPRIQAFYNLFSGSERILCAGIACRSPNDNLYVEDAYMYGFFCGLTVAGLVSSTASDTKNIQVGTIHVDTIDWGVLIGGGVRDICIKELIADNVTAISPSDPSHAIYVGPRSGGAMYERVIIDNLLVNSCAAWTYGNNTTDAFSIRSCSNAWIGNLSIANAQMIGNARDSATVVIDNLLGSLTETTAPNGGVLGALDAQSGASITVNNGNLTAVVSATGTGQNFLFSAASTASIHILSGTYKNTSASPGFFSRFGGVNYTIGKGVSIIWDNAPIATAANSGYMVFLYAAPTGFALVDEPLIDGTSLICFVATGASVNNWRVNIAPEKILDGLLQTSVFSGGGTYNVGYSGFPRSPTLLTAAATSVTLHGTNAVQTQNVGATALSTFNRGTPNQQYLIIAGDSVTSITHGNFANGFVTKDGLNIAAGSWKAVLAVFLMDRLYEVARTGV